MRLKISLSIILSFVLAGIISCRWINKKCDEMLLCTSQIGESFSSGNTENALQLAESLEKYWDSFRKKASVMVKNERLSETDRIISQIAGKIENTPDEVNLSLIELTHLIELLKSSETPSLVNVL